MSASDNFPSHAVAIVGMAGRFPGASDLDAFWNNLKNGVESLVPFSDAELDAAGVTPAQRANPNHVRQGTVLKGADLFDAAFFGLSPREAQIVDPQQRIFLECAWEALEHAGYAPGAIERAVGVYGGATMNTYLISQILRDPALAAAVGGYQLMLGNDKDFLCTRVSYKLDLRGPSMTIQTACSTSLVAVQVACRALERHECDMALAGGVSVSFPQQAGYLYQEGMILSPDGHCRPFDQAARGTRPGAGCGIVVLKRLADALADRDTIHAVIRGAAINNDGAGKAGFTAPSVDGQVEAIAMAQTLAGIDPRSIGYIEAHGTGTPLGDPIEIAALTQVFRASTSDVGFCRLGSLKANLGHLDAAAGVAGLIKAVLALKHRHIPPLLHFTTPNPQLDLEHSPFAASAAGRDWPTGDTPRRAGVSSFGIGGTNAHVVLEEAPAVEARPPAREAQLLVLSARTEAALDAAAQRLAVHLAAHPEQTLADVAWTLQSGRRAFAHRRVVVARDAAQAIEGLTDPQRPSAHGAVHEGGDRPVAFLFSGQGSQFAGMGAGLYRGEPVYRDAIDHCAELLRGPLARDLRDVLFAPAGDTAIHQTRFAQPALFATEYALAMLWRQWGVRPAAMLGHSIGEYVAAHLAGVMSLDDALALVAARGQLMQALPPGGMAAVHLGADELAHRLEAAEGAVEIAAVNAPELCTIAGSAGALAACLARLQSAGIETRALHTSHAFHSSMMAPVLSPFTALVEKVALSAPTLPYVSNVTGQWITPQQATSPAYYAEHLRRAVKFAGGVRTLAADPALHLLEVGPGHALTSLARLGLGREGPRRVSASFGPARDERDDVDALRAAAGRLWLAGAPLHWAGLHGASTPRHVPLPTYPFERKRHWIEPVIEPAASVVQASAVPQRSGDVRDWLFAPTWQRDDALAGTAPHLSGAWLVVGGPADLAEAVAARVVQAGGRAVRVHEGAAFERLADTSFQVRPGAADDVAALVRELRRGETAVAGAIVLWSLVAADDDPARQLRLLYHAQVALANGLDASPAAPLRIVVATAGAHSVLDEAVGAVGLATAYGAVLALPGEVPGLHMRLVDLAATLHLPHARPAAADLVAEAAANDAENLIARRAGRRWLRRFERCPLPVVPIEAWPLKARAVVLITGGLGGMGLAVARRLAERLQARLLLTARTGLPPREQWNDWLASHPRDERHAVAIETIHAIEAAGGEVMVAVADAADPGAMRTALQAARDRWGGIDGVIHAAGVAGAGQLALLKTPADVDAVLAPKAQGLRVLLQLLGETPLDVVVLMSSINAVLGAPGVADYAAANALLDAFAESTAVPAAWRRVVAFDWGAWRDVGMAAKLAVPASRRAAWQAYLQTGIGTAEGLDIFERVLASGRRRVVVVPYDLNQALALGRAASLAPAVASGPAASRAGAGASLPSSDPAFAAPEGLIETALAAIWVELLGVERVSAVDDFFELGGHSLLATRVLARIDDTLGARLALRDVFDAPTLRALARRVSALTATHEDREEIEF